MTDRREDRGMADMPDEKSWLQLEPESVSPDFVARTLERVLADRDEPRTEALPAGFLETYEVPEPSPDFVGRVASAVAAQRLGERNLQEVLKTYETPEPSPDFVARTLQALDSELRSPSEPPARRIGSLLPAALLLAAAILASLLLLTRPAPEDGLRAALRAAWQQDQGPRYSPNATTTLFSRTLRGTRPEALPIVVPDRLLAMAREGDE